VRIRRALPADAPAIATVHVRSWQAAYPGLVPQPYLDRLTPESRLASWWETLSADPVAGTGTLVLVDEPEGEGEVVGFAHFGRAGDDGGHQAVGQAVGEVMTIYLDPTVWGRSLGATLLEAATRELAAAGIETATLWVLETNSRARRFYERLGWRADGTTKLHDWKDFVATDVRYRLDLEATSPEDVNSRSGAS
jgi:RimJ/RimL family protein N-acetyltransferase